MAVGLDHLHELPALAAELVQLTLGAGLQTHAEDVVLEPARGLVVAPPAIVLVPGAVLGAEQRHPPQRYTRLWTVTTLWVVAEIGLFPLDMVLLPSERVPLHIFEPRYRELIAECLDDGREFGLLLSDDRGLRRVGTRAVVTEVLERFDDGRLNVVVEGRERFRLLSLTSGRPFQTAEIEPVEDEPGEPPSEERERAVEQLQRVAELAGADVGEVDARATAFELAARVEFEPELKQRLLELRSEPARLKTLTELLERAATAIEAQNETNRVAQTNGHLRRTPPPPEGERP